MNVKRIAVLTCSLLFTAQAAFGQGDPQVHARIIEEGTKNSNVWNYLLTLAEDLGPRLTGSTRLEQANQWTAQEFERLGLTDVHLHQWGTIPVRFDRGPSFARMTAPMRHDFEFTTPAWSMGTDGPVSGRVFKEPTSLEEVEALGEQLQGAWILTQGRQAGGRQGVVPAGMAPEIEEQMNRRLEELGIIGRIVTNRDDLVRTFSVRNWRTLDPDNIPAEVTMYVRRSDYDAMNSRLADGEEVTVEAHLNNTLVPGPIPVYNTIAEIRGTEKPEEVIIISAHLDSWDGPGSLGTQDNGTGSSVTLETARILMAAGVKPKRTIRFALWTGEEQGLLGSRAYAEGLSEEERARVSAAFVDDGGTNYQGGLDVIESMVPMFTEAIAATNAAFPDKTVRLNVRPRMPSGGSSDHASFNRIGIPGFFWEEVGSGGREGRNYRYIWHTQHDTPRYAVEEYLVQSATNSALVAYNLAMAETLLPRELPAAAAEGGQGRPRPAQGAPINDPRPFNVAVGPLSGTWNAKVSGLEGVPEFNLTFEMSDDGRARGTAQSALGESTLRQVRFNAETGVVTFIHPSSMGMIRFEGKVAGESMTGAFVVGENTVNFEAGRVKES